MKRPDYDKLCEARERAEQDVADYIFERMSKLQAETGYFPERMLVRIYEKYHIVVEEGSYTTVTVETLGGLDDWEASEPIFIRGPFGDPNAPDFFDQLNEPDTPERTEMPE